MVKALKIVGWFFGILTILSSMLLLPFPFSLVGIAIGALMCYGGSRSGRSNLHDVKVDPNEPEMDATESGEPKKSFFGSMNEYFHKHENEFKSYSDFRDRQRRHRRNNFRN